MAVLVYWAWSTGPVRAENRQMDHGAHGQAARGQAARGQAAQGQAVQGGCTFGVALSEAAERKPGGALFKNPAVAHHGHDKSAMDHMKGAHMSHQPRHGGAFYMASTKMHHLEIIFSETCGFSVVFYNAFTEAIRADRFRAFLTAVPDDENEAEVVRILAPAHNATILNAPLGQTIARPFQIRLFVKFPGMVEPQLFTTTIAAGNN
jgi:hypothetical protein